MSTSAAVMVERESEIPVVLVHRASLVFSKLSRLSFRHRVYISRASQAALIARLSDISI
jgi:hypothetical protein